MAAHDPNYQLMPEVMNALLAISSVADATPRLLALGKRHCLERRSHARRKIALPLTLEVRLGTALRALQCASLEKFSGEFRALAILASAEDNGMEPDWDA